MKLLYDLSLQELTEHIKSINEKPYRAKQVYDAVIAGKNAAEISNIGKELAQKLSESFVFQPFTIEKALTSKDGTKKYLLKAFDGQFIECVLMSYEYGSTICISTQAGCKMNCVFCASAKGGFIRDLSAGEMLAQIITVNRDIGGNKTDRKITNVVLMGSGEPLDNYENTVKFIRLANAKEGLNISQRNISLSTCGIVPNIYKLADEGLSVNLTVSLHFTDDSLREKYMPVSKSYKIADVLKAAMYYFNKTKRRFIIEYTLIGGVNDGSADSDALAVLLKGMPCHVNLIRLNDISHTEDGRRAGVAAPYGLTGSADKTAYRFLGELEKKGISASVRRRLGEDICGACGQLLAKFIEGNKSKG